MRASAFGWPRSVLSAWGEPARPGVPPEGETGKREIQTSVLPQAFCSAGGASLRTFRLRS
jgi:hypothetical protein